MLTNVRVSFMGPQGSGKTLAMRTVLKLLTDHGVKTFGVQDETHSFMINMTASEGHLEERK